MYFVADERLRRRAVSEACDGAATAGGRKGRRHSQLPLMLARLKRIEGSSACLPSPGRRPANDVKTER